MTELSAFTSPVTYLETRLGALPDADTLRSLELFWQAEGRAISDTVDRAGTPWVQTYDLHGRRIDRIRAPAGYDRLLGVHLEAGAVGWAFRHGIPAAMQLGFLISYNDMGLYCPVTVTMATAHAVAKFGPPALREAVLPRLLVESAQAWQGATWMTEIGGGSDLGATVETQARAQPDGSWRLTGSKYFCSNAAADGAVVAARPAGAPAGVRGLALFFVPRLRADGSLNLLLRRLKDKIATRAVFTGEIDFEDAEAVLLGEPGHGIYYIMEVLNLSRVCNSIGSVAVAARALGEAYRFARQHTVFGAPLAEQPLMARQFRDHARQIDDAWALTWQSALLLETVRHELPPAYSDAFHHFRLVAHLAKYWTAEVAVNTARWAMEVLGGRGTLAEFGVERLLREAMIAAIWEGPPHRQMLDGLEVMARRGAHRSLAQALSAHVDAAALDRLLQDTEALLARPRAEQEAGSADLFPRWAALAAVGFGERLRSEPRA